MGKMQWQDSLSVGIEPIDNQHKQWIEYYNNTLDAVVSGKSQVQIIKTLGFLLDYTETHFSTEEKYMTGSGYAGLQEHQAKHNELRATLAGLVKDFEEEGATSKLAEALDTFLGNWLINHIHEIDMKFGAHVKKEKIILS
jgi:hemerythrin